jgi:hypothetical protein
MRSFNTILSTILITLIFVVSGFGQRTAPLAQNAALRYWSAFSEIQDVNITDQQAKELNAILDGSAPYDDSKYKELLEKNGLALEIMARATSLPSCDWGLDYELGPELPGEYIRKALVLGRLNVLYVFHSLKAGNNDRAVSALTAGIRFSHDVGNGGSLFATLIAKDLLVNHMKALAGALHLEQLSASQRSQLQTAVNRLGEGLDWQMAAKRDLEALRRDYARDPQASAALNRIISLYVASLNDASKLSSLNQAVEEAPKELANLIPNAKRVLEQRQDLKDTLIQTRSLLQ